MSKNISGQYFKFKNGDSIGEADAEGDAQFLDECFIDAGYYEVITDCQSPKCIIVGRTGSGKSALINKIKKTEERCIEISPEDLAVQFLSNSDIIIVLNSLGVKLDIFYNLFWKHVISVELIKKHYSLNTEEKTRGWFARMSDNLKKKDSAKEKALNYLNQWGEKFWADTEVRVKDITSKLENGVKVAIGADVFDGIKADANGFFGKSTETRLEVVKKAQSIVNEIQAKSLSDVIKLLSEDIFTDNQQKTFIVIDKLDENWIDDTVRFRLIRALIEAMKSFKAIKSVKIIAALRSDLLQKTLEETRDSGFQQEKYQSLFLNISWNKILLKQLIDKRIKKLTRQRYTSTPMGFDEIFPSAVKHESSIDFIINRTLLRPRDAIAFINECISRVIGSGKITVTDIYQAEIDYSIKRLEALCFEWNLNYPKLKEYFSFFQKMPVDFKLSKIDKNAIENYAASHLDENPIDPLDKASLAYLEHNSQGNFLTILIKSIYQTGVIGIKIEGNSLIRWAHNESSPVTDGQIKPSTGILIHPMLWMALGAVIIK